MTRNRLPIDLEALIQVFPHRVARTSELITLGLSSSTVTERCRPGGPWQHLESGVVLLSNAPPTRDQLVASALRYAGPGTVISGWDALHRHGMSTPAGPGRIHVLVPHHRQFRGTDHIVVERTTRMPDPLLCKDFPIAPLPRAAIDTARRLRSTDAVRTLLTEVVRRGRVSPVRLRDELDAGSRRGSALPRRVLSEVSNGIRSVAEAWARRLVRQAGLPPPQWTVPVRAPNGELLGILDAWWDDVGLAWDVDSYQFQPSPAAYAETLRRSSRLTAAGIIVVHTHPARLREDPATVIDELQRAYHHATNRPRPRVTTGEVADVS